MGLTYLGGAIAITKDELRDARRAPFLGIAMANLLGMVRMRPQSVDDLEPKVTRYDDARGIWFFTVELHDDDLPNADFDPLWRFLETTPSTPGAVFVASRESWKDEADWYALVIDGKGTERHIIDHVETDPRFIRSTEAAELIARAWPPAAEVLASLAAYG